MLLRFETQATQKGLG